MINEYSVPEMTFDFEEKSQSVENSRLAETIVGIVCPSYSGSTLLTALLGSHTHIFEGGELHWLLSQDKALVQNIINKSESLLQTDLFWQQLFEQQLDSSNLYDAVFSQVDERIIIDSSKRPGYYEQVTAQNSNRSFVFVYLLKHPMRLLASHVMHRSEKPEFQHLSRPQVIDHILSDLHHQIVYQQLISAKLGRGNRILVVQYEEIVTQTRSVLQYITGELGISFEEEMLDYHHKEHHMLGGNAGPRSQISRSRSGSEANFASEIQSAFYQNLDGIKMDNNYKLFFTPEEINRLNKSEKMHLLLNIMGYAPLT